MIDKEQYNLIALNTNVEMEIWDEGAGGRQDRYNQ